MPILNFRRHLGYALILPLLAGFSSVSMAAEWRFDFRSNEQSGFTHVAPDTVYDTQRGFGFLSKNVERVPQTFAVDVPEGNYDVTVRFGDATSTTATTVKAESRRLMIENLTTAAGQFEARTFTVSVRRPAISTGGQVLIDAREKTPTLVPDWDDRLTLEFNGPHPGVTSVEIKPSNDAITLFIAGDSTVTDQPREPWSAWGPMLPRFFGQGVAVSNLSWAGLTLDSFEHQKRLDKILSMMKTGDYLLIQFGHNDQKDKSKNAGPFTTYKANLKHYVQATRAKGGIPVLVTSMERRRWKDDQPVPTLTSYAEAVRQVGIEDKVAVIDLNAMSLKFYAALGTEGSKKAFVYYPANAFPKQDKPLKDDTHHSPYGGYELARCVVEGIKANVPGLASHLATDLSSFDPSHPDDPAKFDIPPSAETAATEKPAGS